MRLHFLNPLATLIVMIACTCMSFIGLANETWKGTFKLPRGEQKAEAILDFEDGTGMFQLPDLIPVPLRVTEVSQKQDSVFFTIGFRSGPAKCRAKVTGDQMVGVMANPRGDVAFEMKKAEPAPSIFGRPKPPADQPVTVSTHNGTEAEKQVKKRLEGLLKTYDLEKYLYTKEIKIQTGTIPHSHPVLTLNTNFETDTYLLSTFLHEQMHWYTLSKEYDNKKLGEAIFKMYPEVPTALPEGGGDERGTYLHILVCYLEYHTLSQVIGEEQAKAHMEFMTTQHYTWIYKTILKDFDQLKALIGGVGLHFN